MKIEKYIPWLRNLSIKWKLTLIIMAASTVALLLISAAFVTYELIAYKKTMVQNLKTTALIVGSQSIIPLSFGAGYEKEVEDNTLSALKANPHIVAAGIYNGKELYARYPKTMLKESFPKPPVVDEFRFEKNQLVLFQSINDGAGKIGTVYLVSDLQEMHDREIKYAGIILLFMLASSAVAFLLSSFLRGLVSVPISHLAETARTVSSRKNYSLRAEKQGQDELGQLIDVFNEMLTGIQDRDAALQQAHDKLEKRVEERTKDLQTEIVERRKTQEALQQQLTRISLLNQITEAISERQDLSSILHVVLRQLEEHLTVDIGTVYLFNPEGETLVQGAVQHSDPELTGKLNWRKGSAISLEDTGVAPCKEGKTVYLHDTAEMNAYLPSMLAEAGLRSLAAVPLTVEEKLFGILIVARTRVNSFSSGECEFLRMLSGHVALAAHQARLHMELQTAYNDLRQTQQAVMQQDRLRALGQMASGIAHDINNALSPVVGFAGLLLSYEPNLSQSARKHLNYIKTAGEDVAHLVARLREFYRRREEREPLTPLDLNRMMEQVVDLTRPRWRDIPQGRGIMVELNVVATEGLPQVVGIESELREALTNLILNSVDAMPKGGKLTLRTRLSGQNFSPDNTPTHAVLEVIDTGLGMDEETQRRCLEPFFSTKGNRGTGMGLAMVYGVMERHDGRIEIESEIGKGTTIRLIFPLREQASSKPSADNAAPVISPLQVLCIDDEPLLRELVKEILENDGHRVQVADSGQTGLDAFYRAAQRGRPFDIVITDLGMPFLDGREVAKQLKSESPDTPVIMLTGWGAFMKSDGEVPAHVDGILSKPPRSNELREILSRLTKRQKS
jgi:signal transduction histidine kinase/ActR/RegA family two-component response regulator/HAMP domain-containing protein